MRETHGSISKRFRRTLSLLFVLMLLISPVQTPLGGESSTAHAQSQTFELTLTQTEPENGYIMYPGAVIPQDITVNLEESAGNCYVYVRAIEKNNEAGYLTYEIADGWLPLHTPDNEPVDGVYYRYYDQTSAASWPVLANQQIVVSPETVTWSVLDRLAADPSGETWPSMLYDACGITLDEADGSMSAYDGWRVINGDSWEVKVAAQTSDPSIVTALSLPEGLDLFAYDVSLQDDYGCRVQSDSATTVRLPVADGAESAMILHVLNTGKEALAAISSGRAVGLPTVDGVTPIVEVLDAEVVDGHAVFSATSFSPYYVVSGHGNTLKNWWETTQTTRYNFDSEVYGMDAAGNDNRSYVVEPDSTFYLYLYNSGAENTPVAGTWTVTEDTSDNRIMMTTAGDGLGKVISVSADAKEGDELVFTANARTITITVDSSADIIAEAYESANYPVHIGITLDASTISVGNEPRVSGYDNNAWVYVTDMSGSSITVNGYSGAYEQHKTVTPLTGSVGASYLTEDIKTVTMLEGTDNKSVKGIIDLTLDTAANGAIDITPYIQNISWDDIKAKLLSDSSIKSQLKATDGVGISSNQDNYVLRPYVVKLQTSEYVGWHINACFVPVNKADEWIYFDENLNESLGQQVEFLNVPARRPWNGGQGTTASPYYVNPAQPSSNYVKISVSEYVTLTNGQKLRFVGWNTMPNGTGDMYSGEGGTFDAPNNSGNGNPKDDLVAGGTLYAFWDSPLDRLEIHKDLLIDSGQDASGRYKTDFTFTVKLTLPSTLEIDSNMKIIAEEFYVADDSLVSNSTQNIGLQGNQREYTITFTFNEDQYGVIYAPKGTTYVVTETLPSGNDYTLIGSQNTTGTIEGVGEGSIVRFTNGWKNTTGLLRVSKQIAEDSRTVEGWADIKFPFTIELTAPEGVDDPTYTYQLYDNQNKPYGDPVTTTASEITVALAHNESIVFTGVKAGTGYTATEGALADSPFTPVEAEISGNIVANATQEAAFVNQIVETNGLLTITKAFSGCTPEAGESFVFTVTDKDGAEVAEVVIYGTGSKTLSLPYGAYTVTEDNAWSWRYSVNLIEPSRTVEITHQNNPTVTFTNVLSNGQWLDGSAGATNSFPNSTATEHVRSNGGEQ